MLNVIYAEHCKKALYAECLYAGCLDPDEEVIVLMDKFKLIGRNLGRVFKSRHGSAYIGHVLYTFCKTT
jgi:hypothetical protein